MPPADTSERFSRQVILPSVGPEGQKKWSEAQVLLAGEGVGLFSAATALASVGVSNLFILPSGSLDPSPLAVQFPNLRLGLLSGDLQSLPKTSLTIIMSGKKEFRQGLSRELRHQARPALFAWTMGSGFALLAVRHEGGKCPCLECFEIMNPKAFSGGEESLERMTGAMAASEALQWILKGDSPLEGKGWITSLETGVSFYHEIRPSYKCPARLLEEGATIIP
jgi:hypothetical protein